MKGLLHPQLVIVALLCLLGITAYSSDTDTIISQSQGPLHGTLFMTGGGSLPSFIVDEFALLTGGKNCKLLVVTSASTDPYAPKLLSFWINRGFTNASLFHTYDLAVANSDTFAARVDSSTAIWFYGGSPNLLAQSYYGTKTHRAFQNLLSRGGVIGGESAGSMVQGQWNGLYMLNPPIFITPVGVDFTTYPMFNFAPGIILIPHVNKGGVTKWNQCVSAVQDHPKVLGIGIPEAKGVILKQNILTVHGDSITIYDSTTIRNCNPQACYLMLFNGETYNIKDRKQLNFRPRIGKKLADITISVNSPFQFVLPSDVFYDINRGDSLTYSALTKNGTKLPDWLSFDNQKRTFSGTPLGIDIVDIKLTAVDTSGASNFVTFSIHIDSPQSVRSSNIEHNAITFNNNSGILEIKLSPASIDIYDLTIYDMLGKIQYSKSIYPSVTANIDLSFLNKGLYLTTLQSKNNRMSKKIIVLK